MHFGYKDHVKCDAESKLITNYGVTDAAVHDSQCCTDLLEDTDKIIYADSAYSGGEIAENLPEGCENQICEKGARNHPLTDEQKESNRMKSKVRCRIEHIFGFMTNSMNGITIRSIGITLAWFQIGLTNLVYNICRYEFLKRPQKSRDNCALLKKDGAETPRKVCTFTIFELFFEIASYFGQLFCWKVGFLEVPYILFIIAY